MNYYKKRHVIDYFHRVDSVIEKYWKIVEHNIQKDYEILNKIFFFKLMLEPIRYLRLTRANSIIYAIIKIKSF